MTRYLATFILTAAALSAAAGVWTNAVGRAFSAKLLAVDDTAATFVFAEDGATNRIELAKLDPATRQRACREAGYLPVPPVLAPTFRRASEDWVQTQSLEESGRLEPEKAAARRKAILNAFARRCREAGIEDADIKMLSDRIGKRPD